MRFYCVKQRKEVSLCKKKFPDRDDNPLNDRGLSIFKTKRNQKLILNSFEKNRREKKILEENRKFSCSVYYNSVLQASCARKIIRTRAFTQKKI